jgi:hypothetical protein
MNGTDERFENAWWNLVEALAEMGQDKANDLLDKLIDFHYANYSPGDANMIKQIKMGLSDWYDNPGQRRPKK